MAAIFEPLFTKLNFTHEVKILFLNRFVVWVVILTLQIILIDIFLVNINFGYNIFTCQTPYF